jgi:PAS domain S-box-containing protein
MISLDKYGRFLSFNPAAERASGFSAKEVLGQEFVKIGILTEESTQVALGEFQRVVKGEERSPFELIVRREDKSQLFMEANPRLIRPEREAPWVQVILRDITDRKLTEEGREKTDHPASASPEDGGHRDPGRGHCPRF